MYIKLYLFVAGFCHSYTDISDNVCVQQYCLGLACCCAKSFFRDIHSQCAMNDLSVGCCSLQMCCLHVCSSSSSKQSRSVQGPTDSLPWEGQGVGAGAAPSAAGGSTLQPWGEATGGATAGASGGRERSGNAEITPLEVLKPALPDFNPAEKQLRFRTVQRIS